MTYPISHQRNIAIIAHVDHGKTTLVDKLLQQAGTFAAHSDMGERIMDSNPQERERGITILAKNTALVWKDWHINIIDTPGHADFGGEVERVLSMVDSVILLVDAAEGPMPQTRFVTSKALALGLRPILLINKVDKPAARPDWAVDQTFDLFDKLGATPEQLDFPVLYASAIQGWASEKLENPGGDMSPLFQKIIDHVPPPQVDLKGPFQMQVRALSYSSYTGVIGIGRVQRGKIKKNAQVVVVDKNGERRNGKIAQIFGFKGLDKIEWQEAQAGQIISFTGLDPLHISDTLCDPANVEALPALEVDEPTITMTFQVNDSPLAGREGKFVTSRNIKERLDQELLHNVALRVEPTESQNAYKVSGRGELHLAVLIENMRREGFELAISRPKVIMKEIDGVMHEPWETLTIDVESEHQGTVMEKLGERRAELKELIPDESGRVRLEYMVTSRALIGFRSEFLTSTSGSGLMYHAFSHYGPKLEAELGERTKGVMISNGAGKALAYPIFNLQDRSRMFISPGTEVYEGMIVAINARDNDLVVNVLKGKQLTNVRAAGSDENIILTPPIPLTLEYALEFINDDELVEVTPSTIRLRKRFLKEHERKRAA